MNFREYPSHIRYGFHLLALLIVTVWGTTFVSTKVLINNGLHPAHIFLIRFVMAYLCMLPLTRHSRPFARSWKDELVLVAAGVTGGSLYFMTENIALSYSYCSNVSLIVCGTPLITSVLLGIAYKEERLSASQTACSLLALLGMALVVLNGHFVLNLSPVGDALAFCAAVSWAVYSLVIRWLKARYPVSFITRKVFFYGIVTLLPFLLLSPLQVDAGLFARPQVWGNLVYLGVVASFLCYLGWNVVMSRLGVVRATNYIYLNPLVTLITSYICLDEQITPLALLGATMILCGLYFVERIRRRRMTGKEGQSGKGHKWEPHLPTGLHGIFGHGHTDHGKPFFHLFHRDPRK